MGVSLVELARYWRPASYCRQEASSTGKALLRLNSGADDHVMPLIEVGRDAVGELLRRARLRLDTELGQRVDRGAVVQDRIHLGIEPRHDRRRCAGGRIERLPQHALVTRQAG